ncbi:MAG: TIGR03067 domain-containing protein [Pirellulales bacterium]
MGTCLLVAATLLLGAGAPTDAAVAEGLKPFQGTWTPESMEMDGKFLSPERLAKVRLTIDGANFTFETAEDSHAGLYKIDPSKDPKELDIEITRGDEKGKVYLVIYQFADGKMIQSMRVDNKERAREFTGKAGSGNLYEIWKRVK